MANSSVAFKFSFYFIAVDFKLYGQNICESNTAILHSIKRSMTFQLIRI